MDASELTGDVLYRLLTQHTDQVKASTHRKGQKPKGKADRRALELEFSESRVRDS